MDKKDISKALGELTRDGKLAINLEPDKEPSFSFTEKGREDAEKMLREDPKAQAFFLAVCHNTLLNKHPDAIEIILAAYRTARTFHMGTGIYIDSFFQKNQR